MTEPLVLLPGMMCDARVFQPQIAALSVERAVMLAPVTGGERIEQIGSALLDQLPHRFALAGLDLGGIVAMELLRRAPDRVSRLCLINTTPLDEPPAVAAQREPLIVRARAGRLDEVLGELVPPDSLAPGPQRLALLDLLRKMGLALGPDLFERQCRAMQRRRDQQSTLRKCKVPALVLCGAQDALTPVKRHSFMAELIPYARLQVIEEAGHLPTLEAPDAVTQSLREWLAQPLVLR